MPGCGLVHPDIVYLRNTVNVQAGRSLTLPGDVTAGRNSDVFLSNLP